ncbi:MAG: response regulator [Pseudomonadales bacterium]|nr:response regulator [Pseudomonadales bacterium]
MIRNASTSTLLITIIIGIFFHLPAFAVSQPNLPTTSINVSTIDGILNLDGKIQYLEDADALYSVDDIISGHYYGTYKTTPRAFNKGMTTSAFWFVQPLHNPSTSQEINRLLEISYPPLDNIDVYVISSNGTRDIMQAGDSKPFDIRPRQDSSYLFPIHFTANEEKLVLIRVQSEGSVRVPIKLWDPVHYEENNRKYLLIMGIYFGIMLLMFIYNFCIYISIKDINYLFYVCYIAAHTVLQSTLTGFGAEFMWPSFPWFNNQFLIFSILLTEVFALIFTANVLDTKNTTPYGHKVIQAFMAIATLSLFATAVLPYATSLKVVLALGMSMSTFGIFIGIRLAIQGYDTAKFFILAWFSFLLGALLYGATTAGLLPATTFTTNALIIGSTLEVVILSWTLADRLSRMQHDKTKMEKAAKLALQQVNDALIESHEIKDEFLATISHELRTPMNGIISSINHLKNEKDLTTQEPFIHSADRSASHMMLLIDSVLSYTELSSNESVIERHPFQLKKVTNFLDEYFTPQCKDKHLTFMVDINEDVPSLVLGDQRKITQVLVSLIDNAIKFTECGYIRLAIDLDSLDKANKKIKLTFKIEDTGIGIPKTLGSEIFERFSQADSSFHRGHGGLGIGLAIAKQTANLLDAELTYESIPSQGSIFTFTAEFEYTKKPAPLASKESYKIEDLALGKTALVVEDNKVNQLVLKATLKKLGFTVICAINGEDGINKLQKNDIDIILMDCQMPIMDGFEATRNIRQLANVKSLVPIIAVTANAMSKDRNRCLQSGMNDYMSKPVSLSELKEKLLKWLPLGKPVTTNTYANEKSNIVKLGNTP